jgi:hypothetical protein
MGALMHERPALPGHQTAVPLCGVDHRQHQGWCATTRFFQEARVPDSESEKSELECLRLASDLMEMANQTLNPELKAHCLRMAGVWTDRANRKPEQ